MAYSVSADSSGVTAKFGGAVKFDGAGGGE